MKFNDKWTKDVNDRYRQMIKEGYSMDEIIKELGHLMKYHPEGKFNRGFFSYRKFLSTLNEIKFTPKYISFNYYKKESLWYENGYDIICEFNLNDKDYVLILEYLVENNDIFDKEIVYNVFFTLKDRYDDFLKKINKEEDIELLNFLEDETNFGDIIKLFNAISYILLKMVDHLENPIYMLSSTNNIKKMKFYLKSIEDSFDKYELLIDESSLNNKKAYYYIIKND
jgi:hypothetical protein